jgi:hypothetical protein
MTRSGLASILVARMDDRRPRPCEPNLALWSWGFVGLGIVLRLYAYWLDFPLWWDEAFVAVNFLQRDYAGLLEPLDYGQVAPLCFLWSELFLVRLLGFHEWSLRLFPLICSIGGLVVVRIVAARFLDSRAQLLAVAILAVSTHPIRHAADVKPYSADLLVASIVIGLALEWLRRTDQRRWLWALTAFSPLAFLLSHPSIFLVAGAIPALGLAAWRTRNRSVKAAWLAYAFVSGVAYAVIYVFFTAKQASSASSGMAEMWVRSFPPLDSLARFVGWIVVAHTGDLMAYPCGGERGGSTLSLFACVIGAFELVRRGRTTSLLVLVGPLVLAIVGAACRLYPYGGPAPHGSAARIMQYAAPSLCLLVGLGASRILDFVRSERLKSRLVRWSCVILVVVGLVPQVASSLRPYRAYQAEADRQFAREFWPRISRDAEVACLRRDLSVGTWNSIHLDVAVSLCNQAIASPARWQGEVVAWLEAMSRTFELRNRETLRVRISEPGRPPEYERYEVFEFVPGPVVESRRDQDVKGL